MEKEVVKIIIFYNNETKTVKGKIQSILSPDIRDQLINEFIDSYREGTKNEKN